jgi:UPF0716 family protein affecting phage T7 exclusion
MLRSILIAVAAAGMLIAGALTALANTSFGRPVTDRATTTSLHTVASTSSRPTNTQAAKPAVKADEDTAETDTDTDTDEDATETDNDTHGDAVSAVAKSDATAAHETGNKTVNHGGAVSAVARQHESGESHESDD